MLTKYREKSCYLSFFLLSRVLRRMTSNQKQQEKILIKRSRSRKVSKSHVIRNLLSVIFGESWRIREVLWDGNGQVLPIYSARSRQWIWKLKIVKIDTDSWQNSRNDYYIRGAAMPNKENRSTFWQASMSSLRTHAKEQNIMLLLLIRTLNEEFRGMLKILFFASNILSYYPCGFNEEM